MISINSLRVDYEDLTAVEDLTLSVEAGQIFGLVGPNGAGKTSTLKAVAGIIEPTYGEIKLAGYDLDLKHEKALQQIGFMPDFPPVYEKLKVWEYLEVFAAAYHIEYNERLIRARHWIEKVNLLEKWDTLVGELSRGMRQRLILAKTLLHEPRILLLDEPASGLDPIARREFREVIQSVATEGKAVIISSHILSELRGFCNAIGIMEKGRLIVAGDMNKIRSQVGSSKMLTIDLASNNKSVIEKLKEVLEKSSLIEKIQEGTNGSFKANFTGSKEDAAIFLTQLVKKKIPISNFNLEDEDVEDIFFKIGAKEVS